MKFAYIGTYPPRQCGIGTFTQNLFHSMVDQQEKTGSKHEGIIVAMNDLDATYEYPDEVKFMIRQDNGYQ